MQVTIHIENEVFTKVKALLHVITSLEKLQTEVKCNDLKQLLEETRLQKCCDFQSQIKALFEM